MTENTPGPRPLEIQSWKSLNTMTWAVCEYHAILSMHKSLEEAEAAMEAIREARAERQRQWAGPDDEAG